MGEVIEYGNIVKKILKLYQSRYEVMKEMLGITSSMKDIKNPENIDNLLELVKLRQVCIEKADALGQEIRIYNTQIKGYEENSGEWLKIEETRELQLELAKQMLEMDKEHEKNIKSILKVLQKQRENIRTGRQTIKAYICKPPNKRSVFLDEQK